MFLVRSHLWFDQHFSGIFRACRGCWRPLWTKRWRALRTWRSSIDIALNDISCVIAKCCGLWVSKRHSSLCLNFIAACRHWAESSSRQTAVCDEQLNAFRDVDAVRTFEGLSWQCRGLVAFAGTFELQIRHIIWSMHEMIVKKRLYTNFALLFILQNLTVLTVRRLQLNLGIFSKFIFFFFWNERERLLISMFGLRNSLETLKCCVFFFAEIIFIFWYCPWFVITEIFSIL